MIRGLLGKKIGMTQIFDNDGNVIPVTIIVAGPCPVLGLIETPVKKIKLGIEKIKETRLKKPVLGFFKKIGIPAVRFIRDMECTDNKPYQVGQEIKTDLFKAGDFVDVTGISRGKGFQGGMKRWNWKGGPAAHGSMHHRRVGSIGASADPSRTYRGQNMPGHMGARRVSIQGLRVMQVDIENNLLLVKGAVPGAREALLTINRSYKKAYRSLEEKKASHARSLNPMKHSKAKAKGKK